MKSNQYRSKTVILMSLLFLLLSTQLMACTKADFKVYDKLPGEYEIWLESDTKVELVKDNGNGMGEVIVDTYVGEYIVDEQYIYIKQYYYDQEEHHVYTDMFTYYLIDTETDEVSGPLTGDEFHSIRKSLKRNLTSTLRWKSVK